MTESLFPDADLVNYTAEIYGDAMGARLQEIVDLDPRSSSLDIAHRLPVPRHPGCERPVLGSGYDGSSWRNRVADPAPPLHLLRARFPGRGGR